jgi:hypothetical protein
MNHQAGEYKRIARLRRAKSGVSDEPARARSRAYELGQPGLDGASDAVQPDRELR